jgi:hypothetical protein
MKKVKEQQEASGEVVPQQVQRQGEIYNSVKNNLVDKVLVDSREKQEESKEKPDIARSAYPKVTKNYMEDIKEQDSEQELPQAAKSETKASRPAPTPAVDNQALLRKISEA